MKRHMLVPVILMISLFVLGGCSSSSSSSNDNNQSGNTNTQGNLGSLALSGDDTGMIGNTYTPESGTGSSNSSGTFVVWSMPTSSGTDAVLTLGLGSNDEVTTITYIGAYLDSSNNKQVFSYSADCVNNASVCSGMTVDIANSKASFVNVVLDENPLYDPTPETLTLDGTLSWQSI